MENKSIAEILVNAAFWSLIGSAVLLIVYFFKKKKILIYSFWILLSFTIISLFYELFLVILMILSPLALVFIPFILLSIMCHILKFKEITFKKNLKLSLLMLLFFIPVYLGFIFAVFSLQGVAIVFPWLGFFLFAAIIIISAAFYFIMFRKAVKHFYDESDKKIILLYLPFLISELLGLLRIITHGRV